MLQNNGTDSEKEESCVPRNVIKCLSNRDEKYKDVAELELEIDGNVVKK